MSLYNRRAFLKLCTFALPAIAVLSKVPVLRKLPLKSFVFPKETGYPAPLFSFSDDPDTGWTKDDTLTFVAGGIKNIRTPTQ